MNWLSKAILITALGLSLPAFAGGIPAKLYKNPSCGCCSDHAKYLQARGYEVEEIPTHDLPAIKQAHKVPARFEGCHTTLIDGYVFEGHVPVESINRVLKERPMIKGLSVPGMPAGSPGMTGVKQGPLEVYYINLNDSVKPQVYETH